MTLLLDATIRTSVILLCALAAVAMCRRTSAALRHLIVSVAIATASVLPLVQPLVPDVFGARGEPAEAREADQQPQQAKAHADQPDDDQQPANRVDGCVAVAGTRRDCGCVSGRRRER